MGIFDSVEAGIAQFTFLDADVLGAESITYTPKGSSTPVTINAIIDRFPPVRDGSNIPRFAGRIFVMNDATKGILLSASTIIGGTLLVKQRKGGTETVTLTIGRENIETQDAGGMNLVWE